MDKSLTVLNQRAIGDCENGVEACVSDPFCHPTSCRGMERTRQATAGALETAACEWPATGRHLVLKDVDGPISAVGGSECSRDLPGH